MGRSWWGQSPGLSRVPVSLGLGFILLFTEFFFVPPSSTVVGGMAKWQALLLFVWSKRGLFLLGLQSLCACVRGRREDVYDRAEEGIGSSSWCFPLPSCAPQICLILGVLVLFIQGMSPKTRDSYCLKLLRDILLNFLIFLFFVIFYINM